MWPAALTRLLRRRLFTILVLTALLYFLIHLLHNPLNGILRRALVSDDLAIKRQYPLKWRTLQEHVWPTEAANRTNALTESCRNSVQGRFLLVDDRGYVCGRQHILPNGCCDVEIPETVAYSCSTCYAATHCCSAYEHCVSCCLHPAKRPLLEAVLSSIRDRQVAVYAAVADQFELCLVKCRTNSHSVQHENKYRDASAKYCYGPTRAHVSEQEVLGTAMP